MCGGLANRGRSASKADKLDSNDDSNILVEGLRRICRLVSNDSGRNRTGFRGLVEYGSLYASTGSVVGLLAFMSWLIGWAILLGIFRDVLVNILGMALLFLPVMNKSREIVALGTLKLRAIRST